MRYGLRRTTAMLVAMLALVATSAEAFADGDYIAEMETGRNAFRAGDYATAEVAFQGAIKGAETDKQRAMAWFASGLNALRLGHYADAHARAEQSLVFGPDNARAKELLALSSGAQPPAK